MMTTKIYDEITDEELASITSAIKNRYGIDFTSYEKKSLKRGFARLMGKKGMDTIVDLWKAILSDHDFFKNSIDDLTVNLTELFRNPEIWEMLDNDILEKLKSKPIINIWHAGCSTGEEVYSMAMVLDKKNLLHRTRAVATDISKNALDKAIKGRYSNTLLAKYERSMQSYLPNGQISDMFQIDESNATIKSRFKNHVEFKYHNLVSDPAPKKFDIIFCRNVMIYFDDKLKLQVLDSFRNALNEDGFLILGYYDMLPDKAKDYIMQYDPKTRIYQAKTSHAVEIDLNDRPFRTAQVSA
ncbi:MAG: CheR family methyltransferase [Bacteroidota bacterium]